VSKVDLANASVAAVFAIAADTATCETQNSGQGPLNEVSAIALVPDGAPAEVAGQLWVAASRRTPQQGPLQARADAGEAARRHDVPVAHLHTVPAKAFNRSIMKPSFHDIIRFGIYKLDAGDGH